MNIIDRLRAAARAFKLGPYVVQPFDMGWGHDVSQDVRPEFGEYLRTSTTVYSIATGRAAFLKMLPLRLYTKPTERDYDRRRVTSGKLYQLLHKVNPFWTFGRLIEMTEISLCVWGQSFWFLNRGANGSQAPDEIWWGRPDRVKVIPDPVTYIKGYFYEADGQLIPFKASEVIWFRYPNPLDEYAPLSPLSSASLSADFMQDAIRANRNLFRNGINPGGFVVPKTGQTFTPDQAEKLGEDIERRLKGVDKWHRWGVLRADAEIKQIGFNPKEAEFLGGLDFSTEDVARAYHWPLELLGGKRTYENINAARRAAWTLAIIPEATFIADELTEQLLPMFGSEADVAEFDYSDVAELQEAANEEWSRVYQQITAGAIVVNEWRTKHGLEPVPWGDVWWAQLALTPVKDATPPVLAAPPQPANETNRPPAATQEGDEQPGADQSDEAADVMAGENPQDESGRGQRSVVYNSDEHQRLFARFVRRADPHESTFARMTVDLLKRQQDSVIARLHAGQRDAAQAAQEPFDMADWVKRFRLEGRPVIRTIVAAAGADALDDLSLSIAFNVAEPAVARFMELRAQRFAQEVNDTTWEALKASLNEGIAACENIPDLEERVKAVMGERIRSTPETIARTEVIGALNGGTLEAWKQAGDVVESKTWLAALDDRTRDSHIAAHGQTVPLLAEFTVGNQRGPAPGQIGDPGEDINCRCSMQANVREERNVR